MKMPPPPMLLPKARQRERRDAMLDALREPHFNAMQTAAVVIHKHVIAARLACIALEADRQEGEP